MPSPRYPSPLASYIASMRDPDPDGARKFSARVWHEHGVILVIPETLDPFNAATAKGLAEMLFGERKR